MPRAPSPSPHVADVAWPRTLYGRDLNILVLYSPLNQL